MTTITIDEVKGGIKNLVQAINLVYQCQHELGKKELRVMEVEFSDYCNVYVKKEKSNHKTLFYKAMNYRQVQAYLAGYLEGLDY